MQVPFLDKLWISNQNDKSNVFECTLLLAMRISSAPNRRYRLILGVNLLTRTKFTPDTVIRMHGMIYDIAPISFAAGLGSC